MEKTPTLSNAAQLEIMNLVKSGMSMDEALRRAQVRGLARVCGRGWVPGPEVEMRLL